MVPQPDLDAAYGVPVNTLISHVILLITLAIAGRYARELAPGAEPQPALAASLQ